ncbi:hydrolase [Legionella oakridgensis]|uniref:hydrolase n=1 Tax=Legionella oakridgensis TaxID=29423 RepID=UPI0003DE48A5|nr:hydrolase [Legionella oakridgensis]ETO92648.1 putative hydrolase [Legionella oakridgensis RV-2-2007]
MIIKSSFTPAWWLANPHAQTVYPTLVRRLMAPVDRIERFELPDGDFIDLAWAVNGLGTDAPLVVLLHGLGGNMNSTYVGGLMHAFNRCGWRGVLMHFRGASSEPNRLLRAYHSGDTGDLAYFIKTLVQREPHTRKALVGISLGGNVLLKWLGELGKQSWIQAGVAVSVPFQLRLAADRMNRGLSRIYQAYLLREMRVIFARKLQEHASKFSPILRDIKRIDTLRCFWTFDDYITAPLHGFTNVHDYYRKASSRQYLPDIATPTLIIHALDDPFMTSDVLPKARELSPYIILELSHKGGHVGFISGSIPGRPIYWLDQRIPDYLRTYLD